MITIIGRIFTIHLQEQSKNIYKIKIYTKKKIKEFSIDKELFDKQIINIKDQDLVSLQYVNPQKFNIQKIKPMCPRCQSTEMRFRTYVCTKDLMKILYECKSCKKETTI